MGGEGSIQGMITSLNNNKKLLRTKRLFKKENTFLSLKKDYFKAASGVLDFKKASKEELLEIRKKVLKERKKENLIFSTVAFTIISILVYFTIQLFSSNNLAVKKQQTIEFNEKENKFLTLIEDGDEWFKKGHWQNSIFFYEKAKDIFPKNYDINYRLVRSYSLECENNFKNCHKAKKLLDALFLLFPNKEKELSIIKYKLKYEY